MSVRIAAERTTTLATAFLSLAMAMTVVGDVASRQAAPAPAAVQSGKASGPFLCRPGRIPVPTCVQPAAPPASQTAPRQTSGPAAGR
jgi:hypothetical protein